MLLSLRVTQADPGAVVTLDVENGAVIDDAYESIGQLQVSGVGRDKKIFSDFHNLFRFVVTVTGGSAQYFVACSLADNGITTRIENAEISVDVVASEDSVAIGNRNGVDFLKVFPDGSIPVQLDEGEDKVRVFYAQTPSPVSAGITTDVVSYTVPTGKIAYLQLAECSGENIAEWTIELNGDVIGLRRTWFSSGLDTVFDFKSSPKRGLPLQAGDVVTVRVNHYRDAAGLFDGRIQVVEASI
jgi:hypothetical protein